MILNASQKRKQNNYLILKLLTTIGTIDGSKGMALLARLAISWVMQRIHEAFKLTDTSPFIPFTKEMIFSINWKLSDCSLSSSLICLDNNLQVIIKSCVLWMCCSFIWFTEPALGTNDVKEDNKSFNCLNWKKISN